MDYRDKYLKYKAKYLAQREGNQVGGQRLVCHVFPEPTRTVPNPTVAILDEHRFWLQILGDHLRFMELSLHVGETELLQRVADLQAIADTLLQEARAGPGAGPRTQPQPTDLTARALEFGLQVKVLKKEILTRHLVGKVNIHLAPTFLNHMLNELDEYLDLLDTYTKMGEIFVKHPLEYHNLWLPDGAGHAESIACNLDDVERDLRTRAHVCKKMFEDLFHKTHEFIGYLRTDLATFPALDRLTRTADFEMKLFVRLLQEISQMKVDHTVLSTLNPLIVDHMLREECYYLKKLAPFLGQAPNCDPAKERVPMS